MASLRSAANGVSKRKPRNGIATRARSCCMGPQTPQRRPRVSSPLLRGNTITKKQLRCDIRDVAHLQEARITAAKRLIAQESHSLVAPKLLHTAPNSANTFACNISNVAWSHESHKRARMRHRPVAQLLQRTVNARKQSSIAKSARLTRSPCSPQALELWNDEKR